MVNKKAQIKIQQMAFMLIAITLFFVIVGLFFLQIFSSDLGRMVESLEEERALGLVSKLANSPEFSCGSSFGGSKTNCVDFEKIMALKENEIYKKQSNGFWGVNRIEVRKIYPVSSDFCTLDNYPNCGRIEIIKLKDEGIGVSTFVSLCRKELVIDQIYDKCELAELIVYYGGKI